MRSVLGLLLFLTSIQTFAEIEPDDEITIVKRPKSTIYEGSSEYHRINQRSTLALQLLGANPGGTSGGGLVYGYHIDRKQLVLFEVTSGARPNIDWSWGSNWEIKSNSFGVHYKNFTGNSFYYRTGVDFRSVTYDYNYKEWDGTISKRQSFAGDSTAVSFAIGNQWSWETFTMGCDWIGLTVPVGHTIRRESNTGEVGFRDKAFEEDKDHYLKNGVGTGLRFYLGASF